MDIGLHDHMHVQNLKEDTFFCYGEFNYCGNRELPSACYHTEHAFSKQ